jgi:hypothetical protein
MLPQKYALIQDRILSPRMHLIVNHFLVLMKLILLGKQPISFPGLNAKKEDKVIADVGVKKMLDFY